MKKIHLVALTIVIAFASCKESAKKENPIKEDVVEFVDDHTAEKALDWNGTYKSLLPCASCPGIVTTIKLNNDKTFERSEFYLDTKDGSFNDKGNFSFTKDGSRIILKSEKRTSTYSVGENRLTLINKDDLKTSPELAEMYQLRKVSNDETLFSDEPVKGFLTLGHEVATFEPCGSSKIYWINDLANGKLAALYNEKLKEIKTPYTPVLAELVLEDKGKSKDGFSEQYDSVLQVKEIKSVEILTADNFCKR